MRIDYSQVTSMNVRRIDLGTIQQNVDDYAYDCYESFLSHIKWIVHNVKVQAKLGK